MSKFKSLPNPQPEWLNSLRRKAEGMSGRHGEIARLLLSDDFKPPMDRIMTKRPEEQREMLAVLGWRDNEGIEEALRPDGELRQAVADLIGEEGAAFAERMWRRSLDYAMPLARSNAPAAMMRTKEFGSLRIFRQIEELWTALYFFAEDFAPLQYVEKSFSNVHQMQSTPGGIGMTPAFVAQCFTIDTERQLLKLFTSMFEHARATEVPYDISWPTQFLLASDNPEALAFLSEMAVNPDLKEEERGALLEWSESWTLEGFVAILKALDKAPDSIRAGDAVTKLLYNSLILDPKQFKKPGEPDILRLMLDCLTDSKQRDAALSQGETGAYVALWALSRMEMADCLDKACELIANGTDVQKTAALFFMANQFRVSQYQWQAARPVFADPDSWKGTNDSTHLVLALHCLDDFSGSWFHKATGGYLGDSSSGSGWLRLLDKPGREPLGTEKKDLFLTREETLELYVNLRKVIDHLIDADDGAGGGVGFGGKAPLDQANWSWLPRDRVFAPMINLARREIVEDCRPIIDQRPKSDGLIGITMTWEPNELDKIAIDWGLETKPLPVSPFIESKSDALDENIGPINIRDDLCAYFADMIDRDNQARSELLSKVVTDGSHSPAQRLAFMRLFPGSVRYAGRTVFTEEEYREIETVLAGSPPQTRLMLFPLFLKRDPAGLEVSIKRLLTEGNPTAGRELLTIVGKRKDDPAYHDIYRVCVALAGGEEILTVGINPISKKNSNVPRRRPDLRPGLTPLPLPDSSQPLPGELSEH